MVLFKTALECATVRAVCFRIVFNLHACFAPIPYAANCVCLKKHQHHILQIVPIWKKIPYIRYISTCVWVLPAPCKRCIHSGIMSLSKNTVRTVFSHIFLCTSMLQLCPPQRKIPNIRYMSIKYRTYGIFSHFFCARVCWNCVHLKEKYRTYCLDYRPNTCAYTYCRLCPSGKKCRTYGTFQLVFEFCQHHAGGVFTLGIVSISKNTEHTVFSHNGLGYCTNTNMLQLCPSQKIPSIR